METQSLPSLSLLLSRESFRLRSVRLDRWQRFPITPRYLEIELRSGVWTCQHPLMIGY